VGGAHPIVLPSKVLRGVGVGRRYCCAPGNGIFGKWNFVQYQLR